MIRFLCVAFAIPLLALTVTGQGWTDDQLVEKVSGFQDEAILKRLAQTGRLLQQQQAALPAMLARIHGDHREYLIKIERLIGELTDDRYLVRESAERTLIEVGGRAQSVLKQHAEKFSVLEESVRCKRILQKIQANGTTQEENNIKLLLGILLATSYIDGGEQMQRALRSALGHTDLLVVDAALRSLGAQGRDDDADPVAQLLSYKNGACRPSALAALARMPSAKALTLCEQLIDNKSLSRSELCMLQRVLRQRSDGQALLLSLSKSDDPVVAAGAKLILPDTAGEGARVTLLLSDRSTLDGKMLALGGDATRISSDIAGLPKPEIPFAICNTLNFTEHVLQPIKKTRLFLRQGSLINCDLTSIDSQNIRLSSETFGELSLARSEIQGAATDPTIDRLIGASADHDRVRLKSNELLDGNILSVNEGAIEIAINGGNTRMVPKAEIAGFMLQRPRPQENDPTSYARIDLSNGDRIIGFIVGSTKSHLAISAPCIGATVVPITAVTRLELGVGGGAQWGFTLICDYSDNRIIEVDDQGKVTLQLDDIFGAWDAECLDNGNLLITEFAVSRVREIDRKGKDVWVFEDLKSPYDADRLPNGNTLIADTFGNRVIEVSPDQQIVWKYDQGIRPFDCDRLTNGNTLICDVIKDRVIEVSPKGEIVWEVKNMNNVHDADRLPNGNTLITLRSKGSVLEVDRAGTAVWHLDNLKQPSDADRLPNGNTIVAENDGVREFDRHNNVVWQKPMTWAVEVNRY
ncbi:hypothetical protein LBMAG49_11510 [Planctomycetota bacterium]|nr:hypothetical protein LBMAG49_11510 [Planctomycetota bacterium]